jgi:penicillin V acylase-like amidase (Ntn superfamily)
MTNNPAYPDQLANAKRYNKILPERTKGELTGMPGSYSSPDRFARGYILTRSLPVPESHQEALYQAEMVIGTLIRPYFGVVGAGSNSSSIWMVIKDLDEKVIYEKNIFYYQDNNEKNKTQNIIAEDIENGYRKIDLKTMDWNKVPTEYANAITQPTPPEQVKRILTPDQIFGF